MALFKQKIDWEKECLFIKEYFPPHQHDIAHILAVVFAYSLGKRIYSLHPETKIKEISDSLESVELVMALEESDIIFTFADATEINECTFSELVTNASKKA